MTAKVFLEAPLWFLGWVLALHGAGTLVVGTYFSPQSPSGCFLRKVFCVSTGLLMLAVWVFTCGSFGVLRFPAVFLFFLGGILLGVKDKLRFGALEWRAVQGLWRGRSPFERILFLSVLSLAVTTFFAAQTPPVGNDALSYHLYFPRLHVEAGKIVHDSLHPRSLWPSLMGMLYGVGLLFQGSALASLFGWLTAFLAVVSVPLSVSCYLKDRAAARAAVVFMGFIPAVWMQSVYAYVDNAVMLFTFLAFIALWDCRQKGFSTRGAFLAGLCAAALVSIKTYALVPAGILSAFFGAWMVSSGGEARLVQKGKAFAIFLGTIFLFSGFWYLRSWIHTGNPFFPFLAKLFGGAAFGQRMVGYAELPRTFWNFVLLPWNLSFRPSLFGGEPIGALFLAGLPLLLGFARLEKMAKTAMAFAALFLLSWYFAIQHARFVFPALPFLSLGFGELLAVSTRGTVSPLHFRGGAGRLKSAVFGTLLLLQFALCHYYPAKILRAALGTVSAEAYLKSHERSYAFMKEIAPFVSRDDKILFVSESRFFYSPTGAVLMGPLVSFRIKKEGMGLGEWLKKEGIRYLATTSRDGIKRPPAFYLEKDHGLPGFEEKVREVLSIETAVDEGKFLYTLWRREA